MDRIQPAPPIGHHAQNILRKPHVGNSRCSIGILHQAPQLVHSTNDGQHPSRVDKSTAQVDIRSFMLHEAIFPTKSTHSIVLESPTSNSNTSTKQSNPKRLSGTISLEKHVNGSSGLNGTFTIQNDKQKSRIGSLSATLKDIQWKDTDLERNNNNPLTHSNFDVQWHFPLRELYKRTKSSQWSQPSTVSIQKASLPQNIISQDTNFNHCKQPNEKKDQIHEYNVQIIPSTNPTNRPSQMAYTQIFGSYNDRKGLIDTHNAAMNQLYIRQKKKSKKKLFMNTVSKNNVTLDSTIIQSSVSLTPSHMSIKMAPRTCLYDSKYSNSIHQGYDDGCSRPQSIEESKTNMIQTNEANDRLTPSSSNMSEILQFKTQYTPEQGSRSQWFSGISCAISIPSVVHNMNASPLERKFGVSPDSKSNSRQITKKKRKDSKKTMNTDNKPNPAGVTWSLLNTAWDNLHDFGKLVASSTGIKKSTSSSKLIEIIESPHDSDTTYSSPSRQGSFHRTVSFFGDTSDDHDNANIVKTLKAVNSDYSNDSHKISSPVQNDGKNQQVGSSSRTSPNSSWIQNNSMYSPSDSPSFLGSASRLKKKEIQSILSSRHPSTVTLDWQHVKVSTELAIMHVFTPSKNTKDSCAQFVKTNWNATNVIRSLASSSLANEAESMLALSRILTEPPVYSPLPKESGLYPRPLSPKQPKQPKLFKYTDNDENKRTIETSMKAQFAKPATHIYLSCFSGVITPLSFAADVRFDAPSLMMSNTNVLKSSKECPTSVQLFPPHKSMSFANQCQHAYHKFVRSFNTNIAAQYQISPNAWLAGKVDLTSKTFELAASKKFEPLASRTLTRTKRQNGRLNSHQLAYQEYLQFKKFPVRLDRLFKGMTTKTTHTNPTEQSFPHVNPMVVSLQSRLLNPHLSARDWSTFLSNTESKLHPYVFIPKSTTGPRFWTVKLNDVENMSSVASALAFNSVRMVSPMEENIARIWTKRQTSLLNFKEWQSQQYRTSPTGKTYQGVSTLLSASPVAFEFKPDTIISPMKNPIASDSTLYNESMKNKSIPQKLSETEDTTLVPNTGALLGRSMSRSFGMHSGNLTSATISISAGIRSAISIINPRIMSAYINMGLGGKGNGSR